MGGVDRFDALRERFSFSFKSDRCYMVFFCFAIMALVTNMYIITAFIASMANTAATHWSKRYGKDKREGHRHFHIDLARALIAEGLRLQETTQITATGCVPKKQQREAKKKREEDDREAIKEASSKEARLDQVVHERVRQPQGVSKPCHVCKKIKRTPGGYSAYGCVECTHVIRTDCELFRICEECEGQAIWNHSSCSLTVPPDPFASWKDYTDNV